MWYSTPFVLALVGSSKAVPFDLALSLNSTSNDNHSQTSTFMTSTIISASTASTLTGTNSTESIIPEPTSDTEQTPSISSTSDITTTNDPTSQPSLTTTEEQTTEPEITSSTTNTEGYPAITISPLHDPVPEPTPVPGGSHIPCPCPWYLWYLNWLCDDDDSEVTGLFLAVSPNVNFPWPQPPGVNPIAGIEVISDPIPWKPSLEIDEDGLPKEPEESEDPDDCEPETTTLEYRKEFETLSVSDSVTSTIITTTTKSIETTLPCSLTTTGEETSVTTTVSHSTPGPSCNIITPTSPLPADPTDWTGPSDENDATLERRDQPCKLIDFVIYPKSTDNQDEDYKKLVGWLDAMSETAGEKACEYVVAESTQINFVAFIYVHKCTAEWMKFFNQPDLENAVDTAYDWLDHGSLNDPKPLPDEVQSRTTAERRTQDWEVIDDLDGDMIGAREWSGVTPASLKARELQVDYWEQLWEFGQISAPGPAWLRDPEVYESIDNEPAYNYIHDDLNGEGQTIYIVDTLVDSGNSEFDGESRLELLEPEQDFGTPDRISRGHHGTSVAALAGGNTLGVARRSTIVAFAGRQSYARDPRRPNDYIHNAEYYLQGLLTVVDDIVEHGEDRKSSILNMSWGQDREKVPDVFGERMYLLLKKLSDEYDVLLVCSAGNARLGRTVSEDTYPQSLAPELSKMILAGASDKNTYRAEFSLKNNMDVPILYAPGMFVARPDGVFDDGFVLDHGTSFATPKISGLAANIQAWAKEEGVSIKPIKDILFDLANLRTLDVTEDDAQVPYDSTIYGSTKEVVHPIFNGAICFGIPGFMDEDECREIRDIVVETGSESKLQSAMNLGAKGKADATANDQPASRNIIGVNPIIEEAPYLPGDPTGEIEPVPPATYPDLTATTRTDGPTTSSSVSTTEGSATSVTTPSDSPATTSSTISSTTSISSSVPGTTSTAQPPPSTTTQELPEPTETESPPPPFNPGICKAHITEYGAIEGVMAKITLYDDSDIIIGDNSDVVDFDFDGSFDSGWDPIDWDGLYWIYSDALGLNTTFNFVMGIVEKRQDMAFFAFTRWNVVTNVGDQVEWDLSTADEESVPNVSLGGWTYDGSEDVFPANEAAIRDMDFKWECNYDG